MALYGTVSSSDLLRLNSMEDSASNPSFSFCLKLIKVISSLVRRYETDQVYTWLGANILVSLNPNRDINELYNEARHNDISKVGFDILRSLLTIQQASNLRSVPHAYALAEACLRCMRENGHNQSIIISGLSGSGKTETAKYVLKYLVRESARIHLADTKQIIRGASVQVYLLEKPRTLFNADSVCDSFHVFRLFLSSLSLEKSHKLGLRDVAERVQQRPSEVVSRDLTSWRCLLQSLQSLSYTTSDVEEVCNILASIILLNVTRFVPSDVSQSVSSESDCPSPSLTGSHIMGATAGIHPEDMEKVLLAGRLMGLCTRDMTEQLAHQIITRRVQAGNGASRNRRMTEYTTLCNISQAREQRDCLVKALYNSLFNHIVRTINTHLESVSSDVGVCELGILDMFGFERFAQNGFEQFCINYANERLHENFMQVAVKSVHDELLSEGLVPTTTTKEETTTTTTTQLGAFNAMRDCENTPVLMAMKTCAGLLDEVCLLNRLHDVPTNCGGGVSLLDPREIDWIRRLQLQGAAMSSVITVTSGTPGTPLRHPPPPPRGRTPQRNKSPRSSPRRRLCEIEPPITQQTNTPTFSVRHFAGPVVYNACGFVEKNLDRPPIHLLHWIADSVSSAKPAGSSRALICSLLSTMMHSDSVPVKRHPSVRVLSPDTRVPLRAWNQPTGGVVSSPRIRCNSSDRLSKKHAPVMSPRDRIATNSPGRRINTVFGNFKSAMDGLLCRLESHQVRYVRCLRPNVSICGHVSSSEKRQLFGAGDGYANGGTFSVDREHLSEQLQSGGLLAAAMVLRSSFAARYPYAEFLDKYAILWRLHQTPPGQCPCWFEDIIKRLLASSKRIRSLFRQDSGINSQRRLTLFLLCIGLHILPSQRERKTDMNLFTESDKRELTYLIDQFGVKRVHLTDEQADRLNTVSQFRRCQAARTIQRAFRWHRKRCHASRLIQSYWRGYLTRRRNQPSLCMSEPLSTSPVPPPKPTAEPPTPPTVVSPPSISSLQHQSHTFATHTQHLVSRHSLPFNGERRFSQQFHHFWNHKHHARLNCLVPFIRSGPDYFQIRGLIEALS